MYTTRGLTSTIVVCVVNETSINVDKNVFPTNAKGMLLVRL